MPLHLPIEQHNQEIHENKRLWEKKAALRKIYAGFYAQITRHLAPTEGLTIELGSGIGQAKEYIPHCITTDLFPNPWLDRVENAYALSFPSGSVSNLILFDVLHHLEFPGTALLEFSRVLKANGRLLIFDPSMGLLGRIALKLFHHEPLALRAPIQWVAPEGFNPAATSYYAAQGNAWRIFVNHEFSELGQDWNIVDLIYYPAFSYLVSGGFRGPQLFPRACQGWLPTIDAILSLFPKLFSSRMLVVLEKRQVPSVL